tara:strand:+ start:84 stop:2102 length:2019 start_codon:yes stop_codon:yes gene_type:complete
MTLEEILQQSEVDRMLSGNVRPYQNHAFSEYKPTFQEKSYDFINKYLSTPAAKSLVGNKGNFGLMDLTGFSGNAERTARNTGRGIVEGNYGDVALGFGLLGLDVTPTGKIVKPFKEPIAKGVKKLGKKIKKISGSPYGIFKKADETKSVNKYVNTVKKGISGSDWYEKGGKSILKLSDDNPKLANKFAENLATTSAGTGVSPNLAFSIKGHNQAIVGDKIITGRFPKTMGKQIDEIYNTNKYASGQKRIPFADQLATGGGFYSKKSGQANRAVHDIWDGRAWGYTDPSGKPITRGFTPVEHKWMDTQMNKVINKLNKNKVGGKTDWTPGQAQAASWTGAKIDAGLVSPNNAAFSYEEAFPQNFAFQSRETIPGIETGHMKGLIDEPLDVRQAYDREVTNLLYDKQGRDKISKGVGLLTDTSIPTTGYFKGQFNPSRQSKVAVGREKGTPFIDASSEKLLNATEGSYGLLTAQDAAAWHYLAPNKVALKNSTIAELNLGKTLSQDQAKELNNINKTLMKKYKLEFDPIAVVGSDTGVRLIDTTKKNSAFNKNFAKEIKEISSNFGTNANDIKFGTGSSNYFEMDKYVKNINPESKSKIIDSLDNTLPGLANEMNKLDIKFAKEYGYDLSPVILTIRKAISTDGLKGLTALIASGAVPSVVASEITPLLEKHDN